MKNLANCKPSEFLAQTFKIKKSVQEWIDLTEIAEIRKDKPAGIVDLKGLSKEEKEKAIEKNKELWQEQIKKNLAKFFDKMLNDNAEKTLEVLALCCFVDPANVDDYPMSDYFESLGELMSDKGTVGFFTSLVQLGQTNIGIVPKQSE